MKRPLCKGRPLPRYAIEKNSYTGGLNWPSPHSTNNNKSDTNSIGVKMKIGIPMSIVSDKHLQIKIKMSFEISRRYDMAGEQWVG